MSRSPSASSSRVRTGWLLGFGHPLMDITTYVDANLLKKYALKANDAILADSRYESLINEIISGDIKVQLSAGGSTQNVIRVAQAYIDDDGEAVCTFMGSVGDDDYGEQMRCLMKGDSVTCKYQVKEGLSTGTCLVLLSNGGLDRSLVTNLAAADCFEWTDKLEAEITCARIIYSSGFTLGKLFHINQLLAERCRGDKLFCFNLSSDYVTRTHAAKIMQLLPSIGILFGNSSEVKSLSGALNWPETSLHEIIDKLTRVPNSIVGYRVVVITNNCEPIYLAVSSQSQSGVSASIKQIPVPQVATIVDTNCAGDAFVGGFLAHFINHAFDQQGELIARCTLDADQMNDLLTSAVHSAIQCAQAIMQSIGCDTRAIKRLHEKQR